MGSGHPHRALVVGVVLLTSAGAGGAGTPAWADGAFPEAQSVLLPLDRPSEIILATTFGLVSTEDGGATWHYSCESSNTPMLGGGRYALGPPPEDRIYAKTDIGISVSADSACTWSIGSGGPPPIFGSPIRAPFDIFADPSSSKRVFALFQELPEPGVVFQSLDGGATYAGPIYGAPAGSTLMGIESSASAPETIYVAMFQGPEVHPRLVKSLDDGKTWSTGDLEPALGSVIPSLAAVDPEDARRIYLRVKTPAGQAAQYQGIAITSDGGSTWTVPLQVREGALTGFIRLSAQSLLAVGQSAAPVAGDPTVPMLFRSEDGGQSFVGETLPFHPLGLAQRAGVAYVVTQDLADGFALASSTDAGRTWTPRLRFREIRDVKACVRASCGAACDSVAGLALFPPEVCNPPVTCEASNTCKSAASGCGCVLSTPRRSRSAPPLARAGTRGEVGTAVGAGDAQAQAEADAPVGRSGEVLTLGSLLAAAWVGGRRPRPPRSRPRLGPP